MSSVSSHEGSEKDIFLHRMADGLPPRYAAMRKTDLLDTIDSARPRDTDAWSVAATIDDQESVISGPGGAASSIRAMTEGGRETDDDRSTLDGLNDGSGAARDGGIHQVLLTDTTPFRLDALRDLDGVHDNASNLTDDDKRSRSNAAEFGDDGTRSAAADFDHSETSDDEGGGASTHNVVSDDISAPPQPQPSFASVTKSYEELMEENELLHNQLRSLQIAQRHQSDVIENLRSLTNCDEEIYGRALHLSQVTPEELERWNEQAKQQLQHHHHHRHHHHQQHQQHQHQQPSSISSSPAATVPAYSNPAAPPHSNSVTSAPLSGPGAAPPPSSTASGAHHVFDFDHPPTVSVINARTLTQQLVRLAELVTRFVKELVDTNNWQIKLEQDLYKHITDLYFCALPFGTENQELLNLAYADQIRRFQSTLGSNFAKWYRRQTVQSLSLNPATKEHLSQLRAQMTERLVKMLQDIDQDASEKITQHRQVWDEILDLCTALSLEIHGGDADVSVQTLQVGSRYDEDVMAVVGDIHADKDKTVKAVISPLFVDEEEAVLLPARVLLE